MKAINYYVFVNNKSRKFRYFNNSKNAVYVIDGNNHAQISDNTPNYSLNNVVDVHLIDDIYLNLNI